MVNSIRTQARRAFDLLCRWSVALDSFDAKFVDGFGVGGVAGLARAVSKISIWSEAWLVDSPTKVVPEIVWALSFPVRMIQSGSLQNYVLFIVVGLIGCLGYYLHFAHHVVR
jgi:hypothetical protein